MKQKSPVWLICGLLAGVVFAADYRLTGGMKAWGDATAWTPPGVPGVEDKVTVDSGAPVFLETDRTVRSYISAGSGSEQIIGRGGHRTFTVLETLTVDKPAGTARFRGHVTADGSSSLSLRARRVEVTGAGRLSLGEYDESQTDRALRSLEIGEQLRISGGGAVEVFTGYGTVAQLGRIQFGPGGGILCLNHGKKTVRVVQAAGLEGGADAMIGNSEKRAGNDFSGASTVLILNVENGVLRYAGSLEGRMGGVAAEHRLHLVKRGAGIQVLDGPGHSEGTVRVEAGTLVFNHAVNLFSDVTVMAGGTIGGTGTLAGNLTLGRGARLHFHRGRPLSVCGNLWLDPEFGVDSLAGLDASVPPGGYPLVHHARFRTGPYGIRNWGRENAALINGRRCWFESPGLTLRME